MVALPSSPADRSRSGKPGQFTPQEAGLRPRLLHVPGVVRVGRPLPSPPRPARRAAEERAVAQADAAGVVAGGQTGCGAAGGVEAGDGSARAVEGPAVGIGGQAAQREGGVDGAVVGPEVDGTDAAGRRDSDGLQERRPLVEGRVLAPGGGLVVLATVRARRQEGPRGRRPIPRGWRRRGRSAGRGGCARGSRRR